MIDVKGNIRKSSIFGSSDEYYLKVTNCEIKKIYLFFLFFIMFHFQIY